MGEWKMGTKETLKLIRVYKQFECLWNYRCADYRRSDLRRKAWLQLSLAFKKDETIIKRKLKSLRSAYVAEKKKVKSRNSNPSGGPAYETNLFYYNDISFLDSVIVPRKRQNNTDMHSNEDLSEENYEQKQTNSVGDEMFLPVQSTPASPPPPMSPSIVSSYEPLPINNKHQKRRKKRRTSSGYKTNEATKRSKNWVVDKLEENVYSSFGKTVSLQLQQLSPIEATKTMVEIHSLLSKNVIRSLSMRQLEDALSIETSSAESTDQELDQNTLFTPDISFDNQNNVFKLSPQNESPDRSKGHSF